MNKLFFTLAFLLFVLFSCGSDSTSEGYQKPVIKNELKEFQKNYFNTFTKVDQTLVGFLHANESLFEKYFREYANP